MNSPKEKIYISLAEATKYCKYSQEYLSLRARQGNLKAVKFGRNWVTKKEWLEEYLDKATAYNRSNNKTKKVLAPENLPVEASFANFDVDNVAKEFDFEKELTGLTSISDLELGFALHKIKKTLRPALVMRFGFLVAFTISLVVTNLVFGQKSFGLAYNDTMFVLDKISESYDRKVAETTFKLADEAHEFTTNTSELLASSLNSVKGFVANISPSEDDETAEEVIESNIVIDKTYETVVILEDVGSGFNVFVKSIIAKYNDLDAWLEERIVLALEMIYGDMRSYATKLDEGYGETENYFGHGLDENLNAVSKKISQIGTILGNQAQIALHEIGRPFKSIFRGLTQEYQEGESLVKSLINGIVKTTQRISNSFVNSGKFLVSPWSFVPAEVSVGIASEDIEEIRNEIKQLREKGVVAREIIKEVSKITQIQPVKEITKEIVRVDDTKLVALEEEISSWRGDIEELKNITTKLQSHPTYTPVATAPIYIASQGIEVGGSGSFMGIGVSGMVSTNDLSVGGATVLGTDYGDSVTINATTYFQSQVNLSAPLVLTVDSNATVLTVTQAGTGDLVSFSKIGAGSFVIDASGNIAATGSLTLTETGGENWTMGVVAGKLAYSGELTLASGGIGRVVLDAASGVIQANIGDTFYTEGGNPIRASGEELFRKAVIIFRYSMPSQTSSNSFIRISKHFDNTSDISLPTALTGTTRKYRLIINYSDNIDPADLDLNNQHSDWRIVNAAGDVVSSSFELVGQNLSDLEEGKPYLTDQLIIPDTDWQVELKVPTGKTVRIHQIYLVAHDQIN